MFDHALIAPAVSIDEQIIKRFLNFEKPECSCLVYIITAGVARRSWNLSKAKNDGIRACMDRAKIITCTDIDYIIPPGLIDFVNQCGPREHMWVLRRNIRPAAVPKRNWEYWQTIKTRENCLGSWNTMSAASWKFVGGWDERCHGWGFEDYALHRQIKHMGIFTTTIRHFPLMHVIHGSNERKFCQRANFVGDNKLASMMPQPNYLNGA